MSKLLDNLVKVAIAVKRETGPNGTIYYLDDALGSVRSTIDENNNVLNQYWYNPYGGLIDQSNDSYSPKFLWVGTQGYRQTGRLHSDAYVRNRHFGSNEGRWTTVDPLWPVEASHVYCRANPTGSLDPSGMDNTIYRLGTVMQTTGPCGGFAVWWLFETKNTSMNGWLVQRINASLSGSYCSGGILAEQKLCLSPTYMSYFEAWPIQKGQVLVPSNSSPYWDFGYPTDTWSDTPWPCSSSSKVTTGDLMFLPQNPLNLASPPPGFRKGNVPCALDLPSSYTFTGFVPQAHGHASLLSEWGCCSVCKPPPPPASCKKECAAGPCMAPLLALYPS